MAILVGIEEFLSWDQARLAVEGDSAIAIRTDIQYDFFLFLGAARSSLRLLLF
jgi:hypothetical protein